LLVQRKVTKRKHAPVASPAQIRRGFPALLGKRAREPNSPSGKDTRFGLAIGSRKPALSPAMLGAALRG